MGRCLLRHHQFYAGKFFQRPRAFTFNVNNNITTIMYVQLGSLWRMVCGTFEACSTLHPARQRITEQVESITIYSSRVHRCGLTAC